MADHMNPDPLADSAGVPWEGRNFQDNPFANDDGSADPKLIKAIEDFRAGSGEAEAVVAALAQARLLIPLVASLGEAGEGAHGQTVDKSADLAIVAVRTPDGEVGIPIFSSVATMATWNPKARPVPTETIRIAAAAAQEGSTRLILDPGSATFFVFRRPAIWAIGRSEMWQHPVKNLAVKAAIRDGIDADVRVLNWGLVNGDPSYDLSGAELQVILKVAPETTDAENQEITQGIAERWSKHEIISDLVDSIGVSFTNE